jgi:uncharacterized transporter YbjL
MSYGANLVEPGVQFFFKQTLKKCHEFKEKYYNIYYNIFVISSIIIVVGLFLTYKYKGKLTKEQQEANERKKQEYILSKIKNYQSTTKKNSNIITNLPAFNNEYEVIARRLFNQ